MPGQSGLTRSWTRTFNHTHVDKFDCFSSIHLIFPILLVIFLPRLTFAWSDQRQTVFRDSWY